MKKSELKALLKPIIKECIKEAILEDGLLTNIVSEVAQGMRAAPLVESAPAAPAAFEDSIDREALREQRRAASTQQREQLLSAINTDAYGGVDIFEGTTALSQGGSVSNEVSHQGPLSGIEPGDPGVDISNILNMAGNNWSAHMK